MPNGSYTERFLYLKGAGKLGTFVVPEGKRVIVTNMAVYNSSDGTADCFLGVHGIYPFRIHLPGPVGYESLVCKLVAYERETITALTAGLDVHVMVCGYMFADDKGDPPWAPSSARALTNADEELLQDLAA